MSGAPRDNASDNTRQIWLRQVSEHRLGIVWLLTLAGGSWLILRSSAEGFQALLPSLLIMMLYVWYGVRTRRKNYSKFADSVYFLGFLWTLVAVYRAASAPDMKNTEFIPAFGQAVIATGFGMLFRTLLLQFHETLPDVLGQAEQEIDEKVAVLSERLSKASEALGAWPTNLSEAERSLSDAYRRGAGTLTAELEKHTREAGASLSGATTALGTAVNESVALALNGTKMLGDDARLLSDQMKRSTKRVEESISKASTALETATQTLADRLGASPALREFDSTMSDLIRQFVAFRDGSASAAAEAQRCGHLLSDLAATVGRLQKESAAAANEMNALRTTIEGASLSINERVGEAVRDAAQAIDSARQAGERLNATVSEVVDFAEKRISDRLAK
jgi:hypothetical protein